jgi:hypothetical protein
MVRRVTSRSRGVAIEQLGPPDGVQLSERRTHARPSPTPIIAAISKRHRKADRNMTLKKKLTINYPKHTVHNN